MLQCLEAHNIGTDYNDNPLTTMNIHSKYYNDEKFDDLKTHITDINSHNQLVALHLNIQSLPSKFEALEELINTLDSHKIEIDFIILCENLFT